MAISNPGGNLNSVGGAIKQTLASNYIDFRTASGSWAQQYLPDTMEKEAEVFGNRTIGGFLEKIGAEEAMSADQVVWSEQGRLHLAYKCTIADINDITGGGGDAGGGVLTITDDIDGSGMTASEHGIRVNDTVIVANSGGTVKCLVESVSGVTVDVMPYTVATLEDAGLTDTTGSATRVFVYGSEFAKGQDGRSSANKPTFKSFYNKPIIMKDYYEISGSDASQIGWIEVSGEDGQSGYYWYLKASGDTRARFADYMEMAMLEAERAVAASIIDGTATTAIPATGSSSTDYATEGLFAAVNNRGNVTTGVTGVSASTDLDEFDAILAEFDNQGAIEENMMFVNRATALAVDDMLASMNSYGAGGTSYGVFDNSEDMALNLGFSGFRRGSYDFYKSDFKYLNDKGTRGSINSIDETNAIRGIIVPAGVSSVYDQQLGKNMKRPFLHVRYRSSEADNRRFKTWVTGSVGATTSGKDAMELHMLSERCLVTQGANNFMLFK
jgi:hypothetical protein